jgi:hypothetical protein
MIFLLKKWCLGLIVFPYSSFIFAGPLKNDRSREHWLLNRQQIFKLLQLLGHWREIKLSAHNLLYQIKLLIRDVDAVYLLNYLASQGMKHLYNDTTMSKLNVQMMTNKICQSHIPHPLAMLSHNQSVYMKLNWSTARIIHFTTHYLA